VVAQPLDLLHPALGFVAGAVVDEDDLASQFGRMLGECPQARQGVGRLVEHRYDDARERSGIGAQRKGRERRIRRQIQIRRGGPRHSLELAPHAIQGRAPAARAHAGEAATDQAERALPPQSHVRQQDRHASQLQLSDGATGTPRD
jgi:hypothetical protein